jgi:hypothetical protein
VFLVYGGNVYLFKPFSVVDQISKSGVWTVEELQKEAAKFQDFDFELVDPFAALR